MSEETKKKISEAKRGKPLSEKAFASHRRTHVAGKDSEETRKKKGAAWVGRQHSEETKLKMARSRKAYWDKKRLENGV